MTVIKFKVDELDIDDAMIIIRNLLKRSGQTEFSEDLLTSILEGLDNA